MARQGHGRGATNATRKPSPADAPRRRTPPCSADADTDARGDNALRVSVFPRARTNALRSRVVAFVSGW
eukprot:7868696-Lingulodinium_polyedra.AAC.1